MAYELPALPYDAAMLEPHISEQTMKLHYGQHHKGYVTKLNKAIEAGDLADAELETIIRTAHEKSDESLFNNAAQVWNHNFFWNSMAPTISEPTGKLAAALKESFGSLSGFKKAFTEAATTEFGSGWAWLVAGSDGLEAISTGDADLPLVHGKTALVCCDVWEHAYYLDYQNERGDFVGVFLEKLIDWEFASKNWAAID